MATRFKRFLAVDWSGAKGKSQSSIALALAQDDGGPPRWLERAGGWSRADVLAFLRSDLPPETLVGLDLGISLPFADCGAFFPGWAGSPADARALWALVDALCAEEAHLAAGPFLAHPALGEYFHHGTRMGALYQCDGASHRNGRLRATEHAQRALGCRPHSTFKLVGSGQVGKSSLTGMRMLHALAPIVPVWPIREDPGAGSLIVEIYTAIAALAAGRKANATKLRSFEELNQALAHPAIASPPVPGAGRLSEHAADAALGAAWLRQASTKPSLWRPRGLTVPIARTEGWTFGAP